MDMVLSIVAIVLLCIIVYFLLRLRSMMKNVKGASSDMNTIELIKNWQEQKAADAEYEADLRDKAKEAARPEIEKVLTERYKQEAIAKATTPKSDKFKNAMKGSLGIDSDKLFSKDNVDRMVGKRPGINGEVGTDSNKIFDQDRINRMAKGADINPDRIKRASGSLNWDDSVRRGLNSESKFDGIERALGKDKKPQKVYRQDR